MMQLSLEKNSTYPWFEYMDLIVPEITVIMSSICLIGMYRL
jgi:hypothetical protein